MFEIFYDFKSIRELISNLNNDRFKQQLDQIIVDMGFSATNIQELQKHLSANPYLSDAGLPTAADARVYLEFNGQIPDVEKTPNVHYWYMFMYTFSNDLLKKWIEKQNTNKEEPKKQEKKQEKKTAKDEGDDLFDDEPSAPVKKAAPVVKEVKQKKKPIAKSILVFDVKIYDEEEDLDKLSKKVLAIEMDGLVWNNEPKKIPVVGKIFKLQFGCVIEDAKILTDDIFEQIESWDQVQSTDMISMQKL